MAEIKQDLRVKKTQQALVTSLITLLKSQPFPKITVNDICTEAMISRSAFYANFEDKYALLRFSMVIFKQRLVEQSEGLPFRERIRSVLENMQRDAKILRNVLLTELDMELMKMVSDSFLGDMQRLFELRAEDLPPLPGPFEIVSIYFSSAITNAIMFWILNSSICSLDEMVDCLIKLLPSELFDQYV